MKLNIYECSDDLATLLTNLRAEQKGFFASKPGTLQRQKHLQESKQLEKELDKFLQQRKTMDLFSQQKNNYDNGKT